MRARVKVPFRDDRHRDEVEMTFFVIAHGRPFDDWAWC